jgi:hypothetical protein
MRSSPAPWWQEGSYAPRPRSIAPALVNTRKKTFLKAPPLVAKVLCLAERPFSSDPVPCLPTCHASVLYHSCPSCPPGLQGTQKH